MFNLVKQSEYRKVNNKVQKVIIRDVKMIRNNKQILVAADRTTNYYKLLINEYTKLILNSIRKTYKNRQKEQ